MDPKQKAQDASGPSPLTAHHSPLTTHHSPTLPLSHSQPAPLISFEAVGIRFGHHGVLHDLSLQVPRGQTVAIIGESGCGKTVLLKLIVALLRPTAGRVLFEGRILTDLSDAELTQQRLRIGLLFQGAALFDSLTVFDNVAFGLRAQRRLGETEIADIAQQRLREVGLPPGIETKKPAELSGGMKKRVGLARALALEPEVMLYDEPTTGLDPIMSDVINELILQTRQKHPVTSIVVTHDMKTAQKVANRIIMLFPLGRLEAGESQVVFDGTPEELQNCTDPRLRQFVEGEARERLQEMAYRGED